MNASTPKPEGSGLSMYQSLRYGANLNIRALLAIASTFMVISMLTCPNPDPDVIAGILQATSGRWLWCGIFAVNAGLLWWRIFENKSRRIWTVGINAFTFALWFGITGSAIYQLGFLPPGLVAEVVLVLSAGWVMVRSDLTFSDRETA